LSSNAASLRARERSDIALAIDRLQRFTALRVGRVTHNWAGLRNSDFPFAEGLGPDIKFTRTQTIMQGASRCDFRYKRHKD
jgi:L-2-amino-thiazoline-4-carboxylic acid hydrolase